MNEVKIRELLPSGLLKVSGMLEIVDKINHGGCAILPTDTGYLIACDATNENAIKNVFRIKRRKSTNPIHVCVGTVRQAHMVGKFSVKAERLLDTFCPGAISIITPKQDWVSDLLIANTGNIGIRIPDEPCILQICNELKKPITATSVNFADEPPISDIQKIIDSFGSEVDFIVKTNRQSFLQSSTVVRLINDDIEILRAGPISEDLIINVANMPTYSDFRDWT